MIRTEDGATFVKAENAEELVHDMLSVMTTFVAYSKSHGISEELIEETLVKMIVNAFDNAKKGGHIVDFED